MGNDYQKANIFEAAADGNGAAYDGAKWYSIHGFQIEADSTVSAATAEIQGRLSDGADWETIGNTSISPITIADAGNSLVEVYENVFLEVRAVVSNYAGTGDVRVVYLGRVG